MKEIKEKKPRKFLKMLENVGTTVVQEVLLRVIRGVVSRIGGKKQLPSILFLLASCGIAFAQYPATGNKQRLGFQTTADGLVWRGSLSDTASIQPTSNQNAWVILDTVNFKFYSFDFTSNVWNQLPSGTTIDTTSLSNRIDLRVRYADTATMLLPYLRKADTSLLNIQSRLNLKLNIADTSQMLSNYATKAYADTSGRFYARQDFTNVSSSTLTWTQSDTLVVGGVTVVQVYRNGQILLPTQYTIPTKTSVVIGSTAYKAGENYTVIFPRGGGAGSGGGSGSLTSISAGTGITVSPNPITTTGTVSADTSFLFTQSDTLSLNLTSRFAAKLNPADTVSLSNRIDAKGSGTVTSVGSGFGLLGGTITTSGTLRLDTTTIYARLQDSIDVAIGKDTIKILKQEYQPATTNVLTWTVTSKFPIQLKAYILVFRNGQLLNNDQYNLTDTNKITIVSTSFKSGSNYTVATVSGIGSVGTGVYPNPVYPDAGIALSTGSAWASSITNNSANWNTAYNDKVNSLAVTGTTTKTITLTQQDGGTVSGNFTDNGSVTSVGLTVPTGFDVGNSPITSNGNIGLTFSNGYSLPTNASQSNWNTAYNDKIASLAFTGTDTKTLTLNQTDGGTVTNTFTDLQGVTGVTGGTGLTGGTITTTGTLAADTNFLVTRYDTTSMLTNYLRTGVAASTYQPLLSGTTNYLPKFTGTSTLGNSVIQESSGNIGIGITPTANLELAKGKFIMLNSREDEDQDSSGIILYETGTKSSNDINFGAKIMYNAASDNLEIKMKNYNGTTLFNPPVSITIPRATGNVNIGTSLAVTGAITEGGNNVMTNLDTVSLSNRIDNKVGLTENETVAGNKTLSGNTTLSGTVTTSNLTGTANAVVGKTSSNVLTTVTSVNQTGFMYNGSETLKTTDANGNITINHGLSWTPTAIYISFNYQTNANYSVGVWSISSTQFKFTIYDNTNTPLNNIQITGFTWLAIK